MALSPVKSDEYIRSDGCGESYDLPPLHRATSVAITDRFKSGKSVIIGLFSQQLVSHTDFFLDIRVISIVDGDFLANELLWTKHLKATKLYK